MVDIPFHKIGRLAKELNLDVLGIADLAALSQHRASLIDWQERGFAGEMSYMQRDPNLLTDVERILPGAQSAIIFSVSYDRHPQPPRPVGSGRVARYAWGRDYHRVLKKRLQKLVDLLEAELARPFSHRVFTDAVPLLERALAQSAGLGFHGKNTLLIRPGSGSYFFICELISELRVVGAPLNVLDNSCKSCRRCLDSCPTGALVDEYRLDARRCISYLTIEKGGALEWWEREALGEWIFGCDICQEVCPFNHAPLKNSLPPALEEFALERGAGPLLDLGEVLCIQDKDAFMARFGGTPLMRAGITGLQRNAIVVAANTGAENLDSVLREIACRNPSPLLRRHSLWALWRIQEKCNNFPRSALRTLLDRAMCDDDSDVVKEAGEIAAALT